MCKTEVDNVEPSNVKQCKREEEVDNVETSLKHFLQSPILHPKPLAFETMLQNLMDLWGINREEAGKSDGITKSLKTTEWEKAGAKYEYNAGARIKRLNNKTTVKSTRKLFFCNKINVATKIKGHFNHHHQHRHHSDKRGKSFTTNRTL